MHWGLDRSIPLDRSGPSALTRSLTKCQPPAVKLRLEIGDILLDLDKEYSRQNLGMLLELYKSSSLTDTKEAEGSSVSLTLGSSHSTVYPTSMRAPTTPAPSLMSPARRGISIFYSNLTSPAWPNTPISSGNAPLETGYRTPCMASPLW